MQEPLQGSAPNRCSEQAAAGLLPCCTGWYLEESVALHDHVGQALRRCQVLTQLPLVRLPQAALPLAGSGERGR